MNHNNSKIDLNEMENFIERIKLYDVSDSCCSYSYIKNAIAEIHVAAPKLVISKGMQLYRGRVHKNGEQFFSNISDISYINNAFLVTDFGRANEPCQSIFYCSDNPSTAFIETCTISREDIDKDSELITWGIWEVINDIEICYVIGHTKGKTQNETLNALTEGFLKFLKFFPEDEQKVILLFHDFISEHFQIKSKGHHALYKISCAYSNWIYSQEFIDNKENKPEIAGIMYRSAIWPNEGMNIALKNSVVDTNLKLVGAFRDHIIRRGNFYDGSHTIIAKSINLDNNIIIWA